MCFVVFLKDFIKFLVYLCLFVVFLVSWCVCLIPKALGGCRSPKVFCCIPSVLLFVGSVPRVFVLPVVCLCVFVVFL